MFVCGIYELLAHTHVVHVAYVAHVAHVIHATHIACCKWAKNNPITYF